MQRFCFCFFFFSYCLLSTTCGEIKGMRQNAERICRVDQNGDNLRINRVYLRISDYCSVRVRVRVGLGLGLGFGLRLGLVLGLG